MISSPKYKKVIVPYPPRACETKAYQKDHFIPPPQSPRCSSKLKGAKTKRQEPYSRSNYWALKQWLDFAWLNREKNVVSKTGKQELHDELKCLKHKQGARRNNLRVKLSSEDMVTRLLRKVIHALTIHCEGRPCGKDRQCLNQCRPWKSSNLSLIKRCHWPCWKDSSSSIWPFQLCLHTQPTSIKLLAL